MAGKCLPHLGTNWNHNNKGNGNGNIILQPKNTINQLRMNESQKRAQQIINKKGIIFNIPNPNNITQNVIRKNRKRSFEFMNGNKENISPPRKRNRLSNIIKDSNVDDIINQKSINENLRKDIQRENLENELNNLENEEKLHDQLNEITSIQIKVFICCFTGCPIKGKVCEKPNDFCKSHQINITKTMGRKYFWKCENCKSKTYSINTKRVKSKCIKCGKRKFIAASAYNIDKGSNSKINTRKEKFILVNNKSAK